MSDLAKKLAAEFPKEAISWRAQTVTNDGKKALALAYIDARDVMERLDAVCGVEGWQCEYPHANGKTICSIGILIGKEWIWKADGAGDTDIEAEKGAISDAFKRAAVKWGIGRYLYSMDAVWCPCDSYKAGEKWKWSKFTADPWSYVGGIKKSVFGNASLRKTWMENVQDSFNGAISESDLKEIAKLNKPKFDEMTAGGNEHDLLAVDECRKRYDLALSRIRETDARHSQVVAAHGQDFAAIR